MSSESGTTRWWENYLVRYLMPSIAGIVIVSWLCAYGGDGFRGLLLLPPRGDRLDGASITLLFLYGNLFCYVASYPVLVFHVTRVIDFSDDGWPAQPVVDGYITTTLFTLVAFCLFHYFPTYRYLLAYIVALAFVSVQLVRLYMVLFPRIVVRGCSGLVSPAFGYTYALARRRGIPEQTETVGQSAGSDSENHAGDEEEATEDLTTVRQIVWRRDFMDTYRHLREHGNSAFMFLSELALSALVYSVITKPGQTPTQQLGAIGALFAIWALPATFVHLLGQHLERRFSHFDRKVRKARL